MAKKKRAAKKKSSKQSKQPAASGAASGGAGKVIDSLELDTRHTGSESLLKKLAERKATAEDVNTAIDEDSRLEPLRDVLTKMVNGEKVSQEEIDNAVDSKNEPLRPLLESLTQG